MDTNRLSEKITKALNEQMTREAHASQIFLSYGAWADSNGFAGIANFLFRHAQEERNHMMKILEYILKRGGVVRVSAIAAPPSDPTSMNDCFEKIFKHEVENTQSIYAVVSLTLKEED